MEYFTGLYRFLEQGPGASRQVVLLVRYFQSTTEEDMIRALWLFCDNRPKRWLTGRQMLQWLSAGTELPEWLVNRSLNETSDLAEAIALMYPAATDQTALSLTTLLNQVRIFHID